MNRRGFLGAMIRAGVAAMALPAATTYARIWVPKREIIVPELLIVDTDYQCIINEPSHGSILHSLRFYTTCIDVSYEGWLIENFQKS